MRNVGRYWSIPGIWAIFIGMGIISIASGVLVSTPRTALLAIGATGIVAGVLTALVTPQYFVRASLLDRMHGVLASNVALHHPSVVRQGEYLYVPCEREEPGDGAVLVFVAPEDTTVRLSTDVGDSPSPGRDGEGTLLYSTGDALLAEYDEMALTELRSSPAELAQYTVDGLEHGLELVQSATCDVTPSTRQATLEVRGSGLDVGRRFDDPVTSFAGATFAYGLGQPTVVQAEGNEDDGFTISCRWEESALPEDETEQVLASLGSSPSNGD